MHRVLQIQEVLLNIFCHFAPPCLSKKAREDVNYDLAALARTCRAFKEPALDMLWSELDGPSPLIRCLPEISQTLHRSVICRTKSTGGIARKSAPSRIIVIYTSARPIEQTEWDIIRGYARRVRRLRHDVEGEIDWKIISRAYVDLTPAEPLFPNLRSLHCELNKRSIFLFDLPFPSLIHIHFDLDMDWLEIQDPLKSLAETSPNIKKLDFFCENWVPKYSEDDPEYEEIISDGIRSWSNLQSVTCPHIPIDMDALVHLSRTPSLTQLMFTLGDELLDLSIPSGFLSFPALKSIKLHAESLTTISRLLPWVRLPAITDFTVIISSCPAKQDLISFMAGIQEVGISQTIQEFNLGQVPGNPDYVRPRGPGAPLLDLDDLRSCMAFAHLRYMNLDLEWNVNLSGNELLMLGLAWPRLEELLINTNWGWNRPGIMPNELTVLLEACPSLTSIALSIDTRGYTQMPARRFREPISSSSFKHRFRLNVLDSDIERKSMDAMVAFLASIVPHFDFILTAWEIWPMLDDDEEDEYRERWEAVHRQANEIIKERWLNTLCRFLFPSSV